MLELDFKEMRRLAGLDVGIPDFRPHSSKLKMAEGIPDSSILNETTEVEAPKKMDEIAPLIAAAGRMAVTALAKKAVGALAKKKEPEAPEDAPEPKAEEMAPEGMTTWIT